MAQAGGKSDLSQESLAAEVMREFRVKHPDSDRTLVPEIAGEVHHRHPAAPQLALDDVAARQRRVKTLQHIFHADMPHE